MGKVLYVRAVSYNLIISILLTLVRIYVHNLLTAPVGQLMHRVQTVHEQNMALGFLIELNTMYS